ncbi:MAG: hypothetical protein WHT06_06735 [Desulfobacterales bacterium]
MKVASRGPSAPEPRAVGNAPRILGGLCVAAGAAALGAGLAGDHPERAWQALLVNFLLFSSIAQGGVLLAAVASTVRARWAAPVSGLAQAFAGFFPFSFVCFFALALGGKFVFPWLEEDLHGKEVWLNLPFLLARDGLGFLLLYGVGGAFIVQDLKLRLGAGEGGGALRRWLCRRLPQRPGEIERVRRRRRLWGGLYCAAYALVLSLVGFDLVMSLDPHWYSTLFGGYHFVKAFYLGLGGVIVLAVLIRERAKREVPASCLHDLGKLFFAFCLLWADFFYVHLMVIWYGNIPEEASYVILRTVTPPWNALAWAVFLSAFAVPFLVLINRRVKSMPRPMLALCILVLAGLWLEHLLLVGPALHPEAAELPLGVLDGLVFTGFLGLMVLAVTAMLRVFPELLPGIRPAGA